MLGWDFAYYYGITTCFHDNSSVKIFWERIVLIFYLQICFIRSVARIVYYLGGRMRLLEYSKDECLAYGFRMKGVRYLKPNPYLYDWNKISLIKKPNSWACNMFFYWMSYVLEKKILQPLIIDHWWPLTTNLANLTINNNDRWPIDGHDNRSS